jgi:hypothetical protein
MRCAAADGEKLPESEKPSDCDSVGSVFTTATRYCELGWTASAVLKFGVARNVVDCPADASVVLATTDVVGAVGVVLVAGASLVLPPLHATTLQPANRNEILRK